MNYAIVTVAGMSTRFNAGRTEAGLKAIYYEQDPKETLLYSLLRMCRQFDKVVVVGGYQYEALMQYLEQYKHDLGESVITIYNPEYERFGTGYTFKLGLEACLQEKQCSSITLIEGDLWFDEQSLSEVIASGKDTITVSQELIYSNKAVVAYVDSQDKVNYIYSMNHGTLQIAEPFQAIFNSGQVWKFTDLNRIQSDLGLLSEGEWQGTNLQYVNRYFKQIPIDEVQVVQFRQWKNCNTVESYRECTWGA